MSIAARIQQDLHAQIMSGAWPPGHRIANETELVVHYGCARATVSKALSALAQAGLIVRRRKAGSFVAFPHAQSAVLDIADIATVVAARGGGYRFESLDICEIDISSPYFAADVPLLKVEGIHYAADGPFAYETRLISLSAVPAALCIDFHTQSPGAWLIGHVPWSRAQHHITAQTPSAGIARHLDVPPHTACLRIARTTWRGDETVTHVEQWFPGDRYDLVANFTPN